ncbi:hypothetical protein KEM60_00790 [Austwickia sp. TVS 96-490-7B]|uniref:DUF2076 domain-containing protein n=1 Tax=Austwickia sp. TVS 96-490-7B TaxID=2830843 RepID=UPI001C5942BC|nr:DUF2076 domain-containing protein [Austwickia sp. TVS 96-490-7B]MBW3084602.1 hypothetical protein [Austwickia sp. TVS 96-490-7B]
MGFLDRLFGRQQDSAPGQMPPSGQFGAPSPGHQGTAAQAPGAYGMAPPAPPQYGMPPSGQPAPAGAPAAGMPPHGAPLSQADQDKQAVERYQYLLRTAPPDQIEKVHAEAFAKLTPEQRKEVLARLTQGNPAEAPANDSPEALARAATRAEMRQPGTMQQMLGSAPGGGGAGMGMGKVLLASVAGAAVGVAVGHGLMQGIGELGEFIDSGQAEAMLPDSFGDVGLDDFGLDDIF